ncbi:MAG: prepilin-type N-terminal cleavage/methylation domain-containing protein [Planctomycetia bacterium]|nr:prepilin-type N-terminal cleavage/methylation domain-containing protein [Planctomycetia bacterium]
MFPPPSNRRGRIALGQRIAQRRRTARGGMTLVELLMSMFVMSLVALALAAISKAVGNAKAFSDGQGLATQHARVVLSRIESMIEKGTASPDFPVAAVFATQVGTYTFPDILVIWHPTGSPANAAGPPLYRELVIYATDPAAPNRLLEITVPNDTRTTPLLTDTASWQTNLSAIINGTSATKTMLTDLLRTASSNGGTTSTTQLRGAVRFRVTVRPSTTDWASYKSGTVAFNTLNWVQDIYGSQTGLRQVWCRTELQLLPGYDTAINDPTGKTALPFFGSAALYYQLHK